MNYKDVLRSYRAKRTTSQCQRTQHKLYKYIWVDWETVPVAYQNGIIPTYTVTYRALPAGILQTAKVRAPSTQVTLRGLKKYTNYRISVFASTLKGDGNASDQIIVTTDEDSKLPKAEKTLNNAKEIAVVSILLHVM